MERAVLLLRQNPVFAAVDPAVLEGLVRRSAVVRYPAGEVVLREGEPAQRMFALLSGRVKVYHVSPNGEEVVCKLFGAPALFGEAEALGRFDFQEHVRTLEASELLLVPTEVFARFLREEHTAAFRMLVDVAKRLGIASYNQKSLAFHPSTVRLANYLMDYAAWTNDPKATVWRITLTQEQMAAAIGVTRRSVAKDIAAWKEEGILERQGEVYLIHDPAALERYCDPYRLRISYSVSETDFFED